MNNFKKILVWFQSLTNYQKFNILNNLLFLMIFVIWSNDK